MMSILDLDTKRKRAVLTVFCYLYRIGWNRWECTASHPRTE